MNTLELFLTIFFAVAGAAVGSFLNVCISRLPEGLSIVSPRSRCPGCLHTIRYYDNIPLISYLVLGGRCRDCHEKISLKYPTVEFITALFALFLFWKYGLTLKYAVSFIFVCALIVITFIDLDHQIIPDLITLPGIPLCWLGAVFVMEVTWQAATWGLLIGGGCLYAVAAGYELMTKREGMGGGDIKLLAMLGAFLGWQSLLFILLVSSLAGAVVGIAIMIVKGRDMKYAVPFGPFLSIAAIAYMFFGPYAVDLFLAYSRF
ncbi:MAG: prepilin peptidase [Deltaproteobacteria bacterium]|nr:prepilin peptidase [Deltaproteobacteria bacterium]